MSEGVLIRREKSRIALALVFCYYPIPENTRLAYPFGQCGYTSDGLSRGRMAQAQLADRTLVAAHETVLDRWQQEKPDQYNEMAEPVRDDPIYRPLSPSPTEEQFHEEVEQYLQSLPQFRLREVTVIQHGHRHRAEARDVEIVDTRRMAEYRGRVTDVLSGNVDWPADVLTFARERVPDALHRTRFGTAPDSPDASPTDAPPILELLPRAVVERVADSRAVPEPTLARALVELQSTVADDLGSYVSAYEVTEYGVGCVVLSVEQSTIGDALVGYGDDVWRAAARVHAETSPDLRTATTVPLHVACAPADVRLVTRVESDSAPVD